MKKILVLLIALIMVLSLASCNIGGITEGTEKPDGNNNSSGSSQTGNNNGGNDNGDNGGNDGNDGSKEACAFCFDMEGNDRKCDTCGNWVYPDGEAWTAEVPKNLRVTVDDGKFFYTVEKIGEEFYVKMWSGKSEMDNGEIPYEDFVRLTERLTRFKGNASQTEWSKATFQTKYADVYELFAAVMLQSLSGTTVSNMLDDCKDVASSGNERIAGKDCVIKEYDGLLGTKYKVWLWNNMPLKRMYMDQSMEQFEVMFEIHEWDDTITAFSTDIPE